MLVCLWWSAWTCLAEVTHTLLVLLTRGLHRGAVMWLLGGRETEAPAVSLSASSGNSCPDLTWPSPVSWTEDALGVGLAQECAVGLWAPEWDGSVMGFLLHSHAHCTIPPARLPCTLGSRHVFARSVGLLLMRTRYTFEEVNEDPNFCILGLRSLERDQQLSLAWGPAAGRSAGDADESSRCRRPHGPWGVQAPLGAEGPVAAMRPS